MNNKVKKIFIFLGVFIFILSFVACEKTSLTADEKTTINIAFENYLLSQNNGNITTFELKGFYGKFNNAILILYKSEYISNEYRKDTINKIEFKYRPYEQMFVYANEKIYSLKDAYLNILIQSEDLKKARSNYELRNMFNEEEWIEIDNEIILEEKTTFNEEEHTGWPVVSIYIDKNFMHYQFTQEVFKVDLPVKKFIWATQIPYEIYSQKIGKFPDDFRQLYVIKFTQDVTNEELFGYIRKLESYDFVLFVSTSFTEIV